MDPTWKKSASRDLNPFVTNFIRARKKTDVTSADHQNIEIHIRNEKLGQ
jgi:hypothetical protein